MAALMWHARAHFAPALHNPDVVHLDLSGGTPRVERIDWTTSASPHGATRVRHRPLQLTLDVSAEQAGAAIVGANDGPGLPGRPVDERETPGEHQGVLERTPQTDEHGHPRRW